MRHNNRTLQSLDDYDVAICRPIAFTNTTNARGDHDGTGATHTLFTVTGDVFVRIWGVCTVTLTGASATIEVGVAGNTDSLIATETGTDIDINGIYLSATQVIGAVSVATIPGPFVVANGLDIIETVKVASVTAGNIYYICLWRPVSEGQTGARVDMKGNVVPAGVQI